MVAYKVTKSFEFLNAATLLVETSEPQVGPIQYNNMAVRMTTLAVTPLFQAVILLSFHATIVPVFGSPVANISEPVVDPEDIRSQPTPSSLRIHGDWKDWETWEASQDIVQGCPYYKMGYDLDGLPVYAFDFGKWDFRRLARESEEKVAEFPKYFEQGLRREEKDGRINHGGGLVQIIDFDGFSLSHHASSKAIKLAMQLFASLLTVSDVLSYGFFVNVNFSAETFINAARPFVSNYLDKFETYGTRMDKWKPMILRKICADQLPPKYGGSGDWKPVPFH